MNNEASKRKLPPWSNELECAAVRSQDTSPGGNVPQAEAISVASVWQLSTPDAAESALLSGADDFVYRRVDHPNARGLAHKLAYLHGTKHAILTAQGMSALSAIALSQLKPGARVWIGEELYGETVTLFTNTLKRWQVDVRVFDPCDPIQVEDLSNQHVDLVMIETITNPRLQVPDITSVAQATHAAGGVLAVDNTFATHLLCRPLERGADFVVESLGKQVNGHSDGMVGLVAGVDAERMAQVGAAVKTLGLTSSPLDCYLTQRGLMSLAVRMERVCASALALAEALCHVPAVKRVDYPGLPQHATAANANQQLTGGYGWMLSFHVDMGRPELEKLFVALQPDIRFVPSLGDANTTLSHPRSTSHRVMSHELLKKLGIDEGCVRVSCGLEPTQWLIGRFVDALSVG